MSDLATRNLEIVRQYLAAIEQSLSEETLSGFFAPDVVQEEFPNRFFPSGTRRDLPAILAGAQRGKQLLSRQRYDVRNAVADDRRVALEILWRGTLAADVAGQTAGAEIRAHLAVFIEMENGKITSQRNYDCYEPW